MGRGWGKKKIKKKIEGRKEKKERKMLSTGPLWLYLILIPIWKEAGPGSCLGPVPGWEGRPGSIQGGSPRGGGGSWP